MLLPDFVLFGLVVEPVETLPVCGVDTVRLLVIFTPFVAFFRPQMSLRLIYSLSTGDDRSTI